MMPRAGKKLRSQRSPLPEASAHARVGPTPGAGRRGRRSGRRGAVARVSLVMTHIRGGGGSKMAAPMEVAVCTDSAAQLWSCVVWELHSGANLLTYRGGQAGPRGLALLNGEYLLAAQLGKNYINAWELQRKDQLQQKIMCPGPVTCLTTSPNGLYVLAGIAESIYLWEVSTGNLLVILSRHYQDISCLQFTGDSSHFLSGGKDCLVLVWSLCSVLQVDPSRTPAPRHVWSRHTLPITDLHCGLGGPLARVATASLDQTVKLWEVSSGELLLSVLFDVGIMAVTMDLAEHHMFCGGSDGSIFQVDLCTWPGQREKSFQPEQDSGKVFRGHRPRDQRLYHAGAHQHAELRLQAQPAPAALQQAPAGRRARRRAAPRRPHAAPGPPPAGLGAQLPAARGAAARGHVRHHGEERPGRPGAAARARDGAGGRGAQPAQDQPRPVRLLHAYHHAAGQVSAGRGPGPRTPTPAAPGPTRPSSFPFCLDFRPVWGRVV
ncbi:WD repeat-containing protein 18 isoform X2 [Equus przewalskii]|uniref:WD repeat-containing protein 18 n=1 Tax=Equus przewalskii TaxID=9798 RepID=A0ABM4PU98_EQUPR